MIGGWLNLSNIKICKEIVASTEQIMGLMKCPSYSRNILICNFPSIIRMVSFTSLVEQPGKLIV